MNHFNEICEPYEYEKETASGGIEIMKKLSDCLSSEKSLLKMARMFINSDKRDNL